MEESRRKKEEKREKKEEEGRIRRQRGEVFQKEASLNTNRDMINKYGLTLIDG